MTLFRKSVIFLLVLVLLSPLIMSKNISKDKSKDKTKEKYRQYLATIEWYPRDPGQLKQMMNTFFSGAQARKVPGRIVGLIGPHAGLGYSGQCAAHAYKQLEQCPGLERVILLGLSHRAGFYGAVVSDFDYNTTPLGNIPVDTEVTAKLAKEKLFYKSNRVLQYEHSLENHLPFLQYIQQKLKNKSYKIVPILFSRLDKKDYKKMADIIKPYVTDKTVVIASTDFTHYGANYGYVPFKKDIKNNLTKLDMGIIDCIRKMDFETYFDYKKKTGITMCGFAPVGVLLNLFAGENAEATLMDYYKSADRGGDYSFSVSYASIIISKKDGGVNRGPGKAPPQHEMENDMDITIEEKKTLLAIARRTLEDFFNGKSTALEDLEKDYKITPPLKEKAGVFVTLKRNGDLRGCIGTIIGVEPVYEGVRNNALKAAFKDPRFYPLKKGELKKIDMEVSVMTPLQKIADYKKIRLGTDGVIIRQYGRQAVYLPQVATETGWGLDRFLSRLCMKAGLPGDAYQKEGMEFYIFQAQVFGEHDKELKGVLKK